MCYKTTNYTRYFQIKSYVHTENRSYNNEFTINNPIIMQRIHCYPNCTDRVVAGTGGFATTLDTGTCSETPTEPTSFKFCEGH